MKQGLLNKEQSPKCEYCERGSIAPTGTEVLCPVKGIVMLDYFCKKFVYDPLKRQPKKINLGKDFTEEDFKL